jgi:hypothetical protein
MKIQINNTAELLEFIKREDINSTQAFKVVCKFLNVYGFLFGYTKEDIIKQTEFYITKFCQNNTGERPLFLQQKEFEFSIKDLN